MRETRYARVGDAHIAYQVFGDGPLDLVLVADWFGNVEAMWESVDYAHALERLGSFATVVVFDKRGVGLSDPVPLDRLPTLEEWIEDVRAVMDDAEMKAAALVGVGAGGPMVMQFAAMHPHRVAALVLVNTYARLARADDYPAGIPPLVRDRILAGSYTDEKTIAAIAGNEDESFRSWWARYQRQSVSPGTASAMRRMMFEVDVRSVLASIVAPTLVLHRRDDPWVRIGHGRFLASAIPDARLVELDGGEDLFFLGNADALLDEAQEFLTGDRPAPRVDRVLATLLFTDLVDSTATAARVGDRRWRRLLDQHDAVVDHALARHGGRKVKLTGDGVLAVFDGPGRALRCARMILADLHALGLRARSGVHTGEIDVRSDADVGGIAVNVAARIAALAGPDEVLVSSTVRDLVAGSGLEFDDRGVHDLKGVRRQWQVLALRA